MVVDLVSLLLVVFVLVYLRFRFPSKEHQCHHLLVSSSFTFWQLWRQLSTNLVYQLLQQLLRVSFSLQLRLIF